MGASALEDWADTIITVTRGNREDDKDFRFLRAIGRDVDIEEDKLDYDPQHRKLSLSGTGGRHDSKSNNLSLLIIPGSSAVGRASPSGSVKQKTVYRLPWNTDIASSAVWSVEQVLCFF